MAIQLSDTAGIRDATNAIEQEGINRAHAEIEHADIVIEVIDDHNRLAPTDRAYTGITRVIRVLNKIDLSSRPPGIVSEQAGVNLCNLPLGCRTHRSRIGGDRARYRYAQAKHSPKSGFRRFCRFHAL